MLFSGHLNTACTVCELSVISPLESHNVKINCNAGPFQLSAVVGFHFHCLFASMLLIKDMNSEVVCL